MILCCLQFSRMLELPCFGTEDDSRQRNLPLNRNRPCAPPRQIALQDLLCKTKTHPPQKLIVRLKAEQITQCRVHPPTQVSCSAALKLQRGWLCSFRQMLLAIFAASRSKNGIYFMEQCLSFCLCSCISESCIVWASVLIPNMANVLSS